MSLGQPAQDKELTNLRVDDIVSATRVVATNLVTRALTVDAVINNRTVSEFLNSRAGTGGGVAGGNGLAGPSGQPGQPGAVGAQGRAASDIDHPVLPVNGDITLTAAQNGAFLSVTPSNFASFTITLPPIAGTNGVKFNLNCTANANNDVFITLGGSDTNLFHGTIMQPVGLLPAIQVLAGTNGLRFNGSQMQPNDFYQIQSTGLIWQVLGVGQGPNSLGP